MTTTIPAAKSLSIEAFYGTEANEHERGRTTAPVVTILNNIERQLKSLEQAEPITRAKVLEDVVNELHEHKAWLFPVVKSKPNEPVLSLYRTNQMLLNNDFIKRFDKALLLTASTIGLELHLAYPNPLHPNTASMFIPLSKRSTHYQNSLKLMVQHPDKVLGLFEQLLESLKDLRGTQLHHDRLGILLQILDHFYYLSGTNTLSVSEDVVLGELRAGLMDRCLAFSIQAELPPFVLNGQLRPHSLSNPYTFALQAYQPHDPLPSFYYRFPFVTQDPSYLTKEGQRLMCDFSRDLYMKSPHCMSIYRGHCLEFIADALKLGRVIYDKDCLRITPDKNYDLNYLYDNPHLLEQLWHFKQSLTSLMQYDLEHELDAALIAIGLVSAPKKAKKQNNSAEGSVASNTNQSNHQVQTRGSALGDEPIDVMVIEPVQTNTSLTNNHLAAASYLRPFVLLGLSVGILSLMGLEIISLPVALVALAATAVLGCMLYGHGLFADDNNTLNPVPASKTFSVEEEDVKKGSAPGLHKAYGAMRSAHQAEISERLNVESKTSTIRSRA